jgi:hypothetical protein
MDYNIAKQFLGLGLNFWLVGVLLFPAE